MLQGIIGARVPGTNLFHIGLATPCSTVVQITMCLIMYRYIRKRGKVKEKSEEKI